MTGNYISWEGGSKSELSVYLRAFDLLLSGNKFVDAQVNIIYMYVLTCISVVFFYFLRLIFILKSTVI